MGPDGVHPRILKELSDELATPFHNLFSQSISSGSLSSLWKQAIVTPIHQSGDRLNPVNYRPIGLISIPCKFWSVLVQAAILGHLFRNNLLTPSQHGFLPQRSCTTNLLIFMDSLTQAKEDGLITDAVFFDFAKAFDEVPHSLLLFKLHAYGIRGNLLSWISNFLKGRTFRVRIGSTLSSPATQ